MTLIGLLVTPIIVASYAPVVLSLFHDFQFRGRSWIMLPVCNLIQLICIIGLFIPGFWQDLDNGAFISAWMGHAVVLVLNGFALKIGIARTIKEIKSRKET